MKWKKEGNDWYLIPKDGSGLAVVKPRAKSSAFDWTVHGTIAFFAQGGSDSFENAKRCCELLLEAIKK